MHAPLQPHRKRLGQHSPVHCSAVVGGPWRPDSHLPTSAPPPFPWRGQSGGVPYGPQGLTGQQRRTREPSWAGPKAGKRSARPGTPPPATSAQAVGVWDLASTAAPPVPIGSQGARVPPNRARRTPVPVRTQSWDGRVACLCDQEDAMPWPTTPRWAQRQAPMACPTGTGAPGHTCPPRARPSPRPHPCPRARLHTRRRYLPPTCASVGSGGCR